MEDLNKEVLIMCKGIIENTCIDFYDNPNGGYENRCPLCYGMSYGLNESMSTVPHDDDCPYIIAKDLTTNIDLSKI